MKRVSLGKIKKEISPILDDNDVSFAAVFGSSARGERKSTSDIDILVRFSAPKSLLTFIRLERELAQKLKNKVDLVTEEALSPYMRKDVLKEMRTIYEKG